MRDRRTSLRRRVRLTALLTALALLTAACAEPEVVEEVVEDPPTTPAPEPEPEPEPEVEEPEVEEPVEPEAEGAEERGIFLLTEFFEAFPEHEQLADRLLDQIYAEPEPLTVDVDEPLQIAFFLPALEVSDAWARLEGGLTGRLDEIGIPWEITHFLTTPEDHIQQATQVETVLANPDAFDFALFAPTEWEGQKSNVRRLAAAVPTLAYNVANPFFDLWGTDESPFTHIAFDHQVGALLLCDWAIEDTGGEGQVALLRGVPGFVDNLRSQTFADCIEENSNLEVVTEVFADFDRELGFAGASTMLTAHPDIVMMHTASTGMSLGAIAALRERGVLDDVVVNGWGGGSEELVELIAGNMDVTVFRVQDDWGVVGADMIRMHLEGRLDEIPGVVSPGMMIIDRTWTEEQIEEQTEFAFRFSGDIDR